VLCVLLIKLRIIRHQFWFTVPMVGIELPRYVLFKFCIENSDCVE